MVNVDDGFVLGASDTHSSSTLVPCPNYDKIGCYIDKVIFAISLPLGSC